MKLMLLFNPKRNSIRSYLKERGDIPWVTRVPKTKKSGRKSKQTRRNRRKQSPLLFLRSSNLTKEKRQPDMGWRF
jgi:hypothetical protein